jgi:hypothetical protein
MTYYGNILNEISGNVSHYVVEVVVVHIAAWFPEADISISSRVLGIGLECANFSVRKLREKPWIFRPEQPDIGDGIENHSDALKPKAISPTHFICDTCKSNGLNLSSQVVRSVITYLRDPALIAKPRHSLGSRAICRGREPRPRNWGL